MKKLVIPCLYLQYEKAVTGFGQRNLFGDGDVEALASFYSDNGADELLVFDFSSADEEHEKAIGKIKDICLASEIPVIAAALASFYSDNGADELLVFDFSSADEEHEKAIGKIKDICLASEIPVIAAGNIKRAEDVKKLIYAGCAKVVLNFSKQSNIDLLAEVSRRFGKEKMLVAQKMSKN